MLRVGWAIKGWTSPLLPRRTHQKAFKVKQYSIEGTLCQSKINAQGNYLAGLRNYGGASVSSGYCISYSNKMILFSNKYYQMKTVSRSRGSCKKPSYDFTTADRQSFNTRRDSMPITSIAAMHYAKRETCPNMQLNTDLHFPPAPLQDRITTTHASTRGVYDSRKEKNEEMNKLDWKILTLKEIKGIKEQPSQLNNAGKQTRGASRKIFVSISKSNRSSGSSEKRSVEPKLAEVGRELTLLRSISNKRKIVEMVQLQLQENMRTNRFFCS